MMMSVFLRISRNSLSQRSYALQHQQRRYKSRKKLKNLGTPKHPADLALEYMDMVYTPLYADLWPVIRLSLLSTQKYCALVNHRANVDGVDAKLRNLDVYDVMSKAAKTRKRSKTDSQQREEFSDIGHPESVISESRLYSADTIDRYQTDNDVTVRSKSVDTRGNSRTDSPEQYNEQNREDASIKNSENLSEDEFFKNRRNVDLGDFVPTERVITHRESKELLREELIKLSVFDESGNVSVSVLSDVAFFPPANLSVLTFKQGVTTIFPSPKPTGSGLLGYYLMDAASVLPVVALDLDPSDSVLDLCAAPGGKSLAILQTLESGNLVCNDKSASRLKRLKDTLKWYLPEAIHKSVSITSGDGRQFSNANFDKVLVDVPCFTDRHVVTEMINNMFKIARTPERMELPTLQKELLVAGILSCRPGGTVVYSTCTLAPGQNDGVVQAAMEHIWKETKIDVSVQAISSIAKQFRHTFRFYDGCRYGQLVLPTIQANFGPMYFCKIKRMN